MLFVIFEENISWIKKFPQERKFFNFDLEIFGDFLQIYWLSIFVDFYEIFDFLRVFWDFLKIAIFCIFLPIAGGPMSCDI